MKYDLNRKVGSESSRSYKEKCQNGFFDKYMFGKTAVEVGGTGYSEGAQPILPGVINIDIDYPGYDGLHMPFEDESQDYIYTSHCLEHIEDYKTALREWYRVTKTGGYMVIIVPHQFVYEKKKELPSQFAPSHKRFYSPASLLREIEEALEPNSYKIEHMIDHTNHDTLHRNPPDKHSHGPYEIELVLKKMKKPEWDLI